MNNILILCNLHSSMPSDTLVKIAGNSSVNPWTLMIVGMITVFVGLIVINITINVLKQITNRKEKSEAIEEYNETKIIESLMKHIDLSEDEITAISLGLAIEYELYYSDEERVLTFNYPDREPGWINTRR